MKVLIIQSDGEHKGQDSFCRNDYLRECWALRHGFIENGIEDVTVWGRRHKNFKSKPDFNSFDYIFVIEQYEIKWLPDLSKIKKPKKFQWIVDLHCQNPFYYKLISRDCDVILHSTKSLIDGYRKGLESKQHIWFPNAVDDRYFDAQKLTHKRREGFIFVGSDLQERKELTNWAVKNIGLKSMFKTGEDMIMAINSAQVHFNKSISCDVNYRNFETIGLATCLLTNYLPELEELGFKDGYNCLMYKNKAEIKEKLEYAMSRNEGENPDFGGGPIWNEIGWEGYELSKQHTYTKRVKDLIDENCLS